MIIMSSLVSLSLYISTLVISLCFHLLLSPASSFRQPQPPNSPDWVSIEEKTRLGSTPPSCHNKCNGCHPCMAVQVPTLPSHDRFQPGLSKAITNSMQFFDPSGNQYSNYKPLGWKCRCGDRFYNP
ncbi:EPIDERMAL PATTERNING FACTOR-like protein 1 isoform X2 [Durio zibethinus]|uniref:Epidermal patterning factor-like protein n=1 Tax=Durio zibethinus TaxID=66656 RepID=A0A6P5ZGP9_DURZI|nr:EPIDERMAL PATTERNING FACTOR-like protein 1 isoform X2 [Durio zibethinus]